MAKIMRKKNLKIQILVGNPVNSWFSAGSQISSTLSRCSGLKIKVRSKKHQECGYDDGPKKQLR